MIWAALGGVLGAVAGSFLATAALRWPAGRSVMHGRSRCDACGVVIGARDLVPLISFAVRRGRCAACGARIDPRHPAMEALCAVIGATAFGLAPGLTGLGGALFGWLLALLALTDLDHFWLPDRVTATLALTGLAFGALGAPPWPIDRVIGLAAGYLGLAAIGLGYRLARGREGLGGGDPKLLGAIGAWLGWALLPQMLVLAALVGLAAAFILWRRGVAVGPQTRLPFGTLMALAAWPIWVFAYAHG
ncbi:prepilin peptidase [Sphingomonas changnyeongensis]|uniref:Prepilin leader peptidase/N-methyltransferase n=2 Tax=Sphingomonas changnyeongensis TaxID=2698679 RepID=A0A7Z2NXW8_9SPHN|nr:A24 family peptidase [Sphingomonas changnyeongensis]QHL91850.1 prepilin peptidase [Sphingomonas changnyeongensis]